MLKVNVGLSRKLTQDYNSTGYSVNIEGELQAPLEQPQSILKHIQHLFKLAEDALAQKIDSDQSKQAKSHRVEQAPHGNGTARTPAPPPESNEHREIQNRDGQPEPATDKQLRFMHGLAKKQGLSRTQLEDYIADVLGRRVTINQLAKREAGRVIDGMTKHAPANGQR